MRKRRCWRHPIPIDPCIVFSCVVIGWLYLALSLIYNDLKRAGIKRRRRCLHQVSFPAAQMATAFHMHHHLQNALKIVLVGDSGVGKTWLLSRAQELYATFSDDGYSLFKKPFEPSKVYSPTVFESYFTNIDTQHLGNYQTNIWDTGGWWIFNSVRPLTYVGADVFMLCFDVTNPESFNNITKCWLPEVQKYQPGIPVLFVGTKSDLRAENERWVVFSFQGYNSWCRG